MMILQGGQTLKSQHVCTERYEKCCQRVKNSLLTPLKSLAGNAAGQASISAVQLPLRTFQGIGVPQILGLVVGLKQGQGDLAISGNNDFLGTKMSCERGACQSLEGAGVKMGNRQEHFLALHLQGC